MQNSFLIWCELMGITDVCDSNPRNFLRTKEPVIQEIKVSQMTDAQAPKTNFLGEKKVQEDILSEKVQNRTDSCGSLKELSQGIEEVLKNFAPCQMATHTLLGTGITENPHVMVISEKPCAEEDKRGILFLGSEGELRKRMLGAIGLSTDIQTYMGLFFPWRTPGDRSLTPFEKKIGHILIRRQIDLIQPKYLLLMGATPAELVDTLPLPQLRGKWLTYTGSGKQIPTRVTVSPTMVLENPKIYRPKCWEDLCALKQEVQNPYRTALLKALQDYQNRFPEETQTVQKMCSFIKDNPDCFDRSLKSGHITGSAWVLSPDKSKALLTHHKKLNHWYQLGGHSDGDGDTRRVALREATEESGIKGLSLMMPDIFDIDVHLIPENPAKKEPAHYHYDVRFLVQAPCLEYAISEESNDLRWFSKEDFSCEKFSGEFSEEMMRMVRKWIKIS